MSLNGWIVWVEDDGVHVAPEIGYHIHMLNKSNQEFFSDGTLVGTIHEFPPRASSKDTDTPE